MGERINIPQAAQLLRQQDQILILCHRNPDGDTIGCGSALLRGLRALGKEARLACSDRIPGRFAELLPEEEVDFEPQLVVAVDVATPELLGDKLAFWGERVDLCIDHHGSNQDYARFLLLEPKAAAACELIFLLLKELGVEITPEIADCLYSGLATDTGCFRYPNTTPRTLRMAAELLELGCRQEVLNQRYFETLTRGRLEVERQALEGLEYALEGRCALMTLSQAMLEESGAKEDELDGLSALPRQIEGVWAGVTLRELKDRSGYRVSLRTTAEVDASAVCSRLGGGGHSRAAGCTVRGDWAKARQLVLEAVRQEMESHGRLAAH